MLGPADEVTAAPCPTNGLVVAASGPVTLDFGGRTIAGNGQAAWTWTGGACGLAHSVVAGP